MLRRSPITYPLRYLSGPAAVYRSTAHSTRFALRRFDAGSFSSSVSRAATTEERRQRNRTVNLQRWLQRPRRPGDHYEVSNIYFLGILPFSLIAFLVVCRFKPGLTDRLTRACSIEGKQARAESSLKRRAKRMEDRSRKHCGVASKRRPDIKAPRHTST